MEIIAKISKGSNMDQIYIPKIRYGLNVGEYVIVRPLKEEKLIDSKQISNDETRVWLKISPDEHKSYLEGDKGLKGYTLYNSIFQTRNTLVSQLKPLQPFKPKNEDIDFSKLDLEKKDE